MIVCFRVCPKCYSFDLPDSEPFDQKGYPPLRWEWAAGCHPPKLAPLALITAQNGLISVLCEEQKELLQGRILDASPI